MKVRGFDEAYTDCDLCGKAELKGTYVVEHTDGTVVHYGSICYGKARGIDAGAAKKELRTALAEVKAAKVANLAAALVELRDSIEHKAYGNAEFAAYRSMHGQVGKVVADTVRAAVAPFMAAYVEKRASIAEKYGVETSTLGAY